VTCFLTGCDDLPWNDPYPYEDSKANTLYSAFTSRPQHLDPARSYSASEWPIIMQIYEPPLQYHYLKRPYVLEPLTASELPEVHYYDATGKELSEIEDGEAVAYSDYLIKIKPGILYQSHPAFARDETGNLRYHHLGPQEINHYQTLVDFNASGTREVIAEDFVYQIKRLAEPNLSSPIFGLMSRYIVGLKELRERLLRESTHSAEKLEMDLRSYDLEGAKVIDRYTYKIRIKGKYPQFHFWLAMPFFAPVPNEVAQFFAQAGFEENNLSLDWYPVGTGPFMLNENKPNRRITLIRNPNFRGELYPHEGSEEDKEKGYLEAAGKPIPALEKVIFSLEKEEIPHWDKFLQGYYDMSGISSDNFNGAIRLSSVGAAQVSDKLKEQGIQLRSSYSPDVFYWGFNMLDETVGGYTEQAKNLRKAISLAFDINEFIFIFMNGRAERAFGPLPPDIFGHEVQVKKEGTLQQAKELLKKAGVKENLTIYLDVIVSGDPEEIAMHSWLKEQFSKLDLQLVIRGSDAIHFQDKVQNGSVGMFFYGWNADYPDPENFLFLFYGPNGSAEFSGENNVNYKNPEFDKLFEKMRMLPDGPLRLEIIRKMIELLQIDTPWIWGFYPKSFALYHSWMKVGKPSGIINNTLKYANLDPNLRARLRMAWNKPILWPIGLFFVLLFVLTIVILYRLWQREQESVKRIN